MLLVIDKNVKAITTYDLREYLTDYQSRLTVSKQSVYNVRRNLLSFFRRTMATVAIDKGMPIEQAQNLLGHEKIDTTLHYAMVKQSNVKNAQRKYIG